MHKYLPFIREKKEIINAYHRVRPQPNLEFEQWSTLEYVYISNLIEGGSLSRIEVKQVIEKDLTIGGKTLAELNSVVAQAKAVDWLRRSASLSRYDVNEQLLISLHHLPTTTEKESGFLKYSYQVPYVLTEFAEWLHQQRDSEVEIAVAAHIKLLEMKPFKDDNPRIARLLMNMLLLMDGYPLAVIEESQVNSYRVAVEQVSIGETAPLVDLLFGAIDQSSDTYLSAIEQKKEGRSVRLLKIGQLAAATKETVPTIRHWTKQGLLQVAEYSAGGYQLYDQYMAEVVIKIRQLQREKRMKVAEIKEVLRTDGNRN